MFNSVISYFKEQGIKLNTVSPPSGFKVYYNCDSLLFMRGNFGDTIKIQMIDKGVGLTVSSYAEKWFKIIDKNTLELIYFAMETTTVENYKSISYLKAVDLSKYKSLYATFIPLDSIPEFNNGLKKDKFFWEDEKDWKEYMNSLKLKKKNKK